MNLNEFQLRAVQSGDGPVLVLAGPGSGKTATIIEKIKYLIHHKNTKPEKILVITFTKAAAEEMKSRYLNEQNISGVNPRFMTIHALCYEVLRKKKGVSKLEISDEGQLDNLITDVIELFSGDVKCLEEWQNQFEYILVDEFQDTSLKQAEVIFLLGKKCKNITVVGDDDQSIYGFRGGTPEVFALFLSEFSQAEVIQLKSNYRSREEIIRASEKLIRNNKNRINKEAVLCMNTKQSQRQAVAVCAYESQWAQMEEIIKDIGKLSKEISFDEIGILFRTKQQFRVFLLCAQLKGIPVCCKENDKYNRLYIINDICSYLKILLGIGKREDYIRVMNRPERRLGREFLNSPEVAEEEWLNSVIQVNKGEANVLKKFLYEINFLRTLSPYLVLCHLYYQMGYWNFAVGQGEISELDKESVEGILKEILRFGKKTKNLTELYELLEEEQFGKKGVNVFTMHGSKGLEFDTVFLPDLNEDILPNKKAVQSSGMEEERRLFYVALTRAKTSVYLSWIKRKNNRDINPSIFLQELIV